MFEDLRARSFVESDAVAARQDKGRTRAHRDLEPVLAFQSALLQVGDSLTQVFDAIDVDRSFALEVVGEQHMWRAIRQLDHRHPRTHSLDRERELAAKHVGEEPRVGRDVAAGRVQIVELEERRQLLASERLIEGWSSTCPECAVFASTHRRARPARKAEPTGAISTLQPTPSGWPAPAASSRPPASAA